MIDRPIILGSGSPRRKSLMEDAGYVFEVAVASVDELDDASMAPVALTEANAVLKAAAVADLHPGALVIGADTLVFIDDQSLGKPADLDEAKRMISRLSGRQHQVCTAVCLCCQEIELSHVFHDITNVMFNDLSPQGIDDYLSKIDPLDKAGAYAAQEHGELIIAHMEGSYTNVVGLPMERLRAEFHALGIC